MFCPTYKVTISDYKTHLYFVFVSYADNQYAAISLLTTPFYQAWVPTTVGNAEVTLAVE